MRRCNFLLLVVLTVLALNIFLLSSCALAQDKASKNQDGKTTVEAQCAEEETRKIWETLKKTDAVKERLKGVTETGNCLDFIQSVKHIDLNDDGQSELSVVGTPKLYATGDSAAVWIFQKTGEDYRQLLQESDVGYKILDETTDGFHDLYFVSRRKPRRFVLSTYQYKNSRYESVKCLVGIPFGNGDQSKLFSCNNEKGMKEFEKANGIIGKP